MPRTWWLSVVLLAGCSSDPAAPTLSIVSQAPSSIAIGVDDENDVSLRLSYGDEDGDLGGGTMYVHDCRGADAMLALPIPPLASAEAVEDGRSISGELIALLPDIDVESGGPPAFCTSSGVDSGDELVFCVEVEDTAGNRSDGMCSEPISVR